MIHIFHLITVFVILNEISWIINPKEKVKKLAKMIEIAKEDNGITILNDEEKIQFFWFLFKGILFILWMIIGLMTFNWLLFLAMLNLTILVSVISKKYRFNNYYILIHWLNSIVGFAFGIFVLINTYHLRIDLVDVLFGYLN